MMYEYDLLGQLTDKTRDVMRENLVGIYLHGSLAMDCFHPDKSDIDLLVVVRHRLPDKQKRRYMDMIVEHARDEITACNSYLILNLCRVLAYKNERLILSKREGGEWGLEHVPAAYRPLILEALRDYRGMEEAKKSSVPAEEAAARNMCRDALAKEYADYMLEQIEKG